MARRIVWTQEALDDLGSIAEYIRRDSLHYARAVIRNIRVLAGKLPEFPEAGRVVPELGRRDIRERFIYSYRLIYRLGAEALLIVAVIHGRRLLENVEERFSS